MSNKEIKMQKQIDKFKAMNDEMYQYIVMLQEHKAFADNIIEQYATKCKMYEEALLNNFDESELGEQEEAL